MSNLLKFLSEYWTVIAGIGLASAYVIEKCVVYYKDVKNKKKAYHKVFTGIIKLYYSYQKHKLLYAEEAVMGVSNEIYVLIVAHLDTFNEDIAQFKKIINEETDVIPEISLATHSVFDIVDRLQITDRISNSGQPNTSISDIEKLVIKRAQFFALEDFLGEFFKDLIVDVQKKTLIEKKFIEKLFYIDTEEYHEELLKEQMNLMSRYYESLKRQGLISEADLLSIRQHLNLT